MISARRLTLIILLLPGNLTAAESAAGARELLDAGAKNTPPAVAAARDRYESLKRADPKDPRIDYAYGLVLVNQHRYADALPLVARYLVAAGDDLPAHQTEICALIQLRKVRQALDAAVALAGRLPKPPAKGNAPAEGVDISEFLGTVFGYLELIRPGAGDAQLISERKNQIISLLGKTYLPAFDLGREAVATRLADLQAEFENKQQKAVALVEDRQEKAKAAIDKDRGDAATEKVTTQASAERLRDAGRELSVIQQQLASLQQDRTRLSAQIITGQAQLVEITTPTTDTTNRSLVGNRFGEAPRQGDNYYYTVETSRTSISLERYVQANALGISLARLNKQAFDMDRQILGLKIRAANLMGDGAKSAELLEESATLAAKAEKRAVALERQLNRIKTPAAARLSTPRSAAPTGRMAQFSTYVPFPYEQERERVLSWFAK